MAALVCDICGGSLTMAEGGEGAVCDSCGMKHDKRRVQKKVQEIRGSVRVEGIANIDNLLARAKEYEKEGGFYKAAEYYNRVLDIDVHNCEAKDRYRFLTTPPSIGEELQATVVSINDYVVIVILPNGMRGNINYSACGMDKRDSVINMFRISDEIKVKVVSNDIIKGIELSHNELQKIIGQTKDEQKNKSEEHSMREAQRLQLENQGLCGNCGGELIYSPIDSTPRNSFPCASCGKEQHPSYPLRESRKKQGLCEYCGGNLKRKKYLTDSIRCVTCHNIIFLSDNEEKRLGLHYREHCYIATVVYGSYDAPQVLVLRQYRDNHLSKSALGRLFICVYYQLSPPIARWMRGKVRINKSVRQVLDSIVERITKQ